MLQLLQQKNVANKYCNKKCCSKNLATKNVATKKNVANIEKNWATANFEKKKR